MVKILKELRVTVRELRADVNRMHIPLENNWKYMEEHRKITKFICKQRS